MAESSASPVHYQKHCPGCFQLKDGAAVCPHCGYDESIVRSPLFLPHGTILGGQYRTGRVLGRPGGFGITYLGWDVNLQQRVAIKEYLPREIAQRMPNTLEVDVHTNDDRRGFEFGKEQFLREARIVAKLDHPNIVRVRNFFNANSTAYLVMDYYEGMSLGDYLGSVRATLEPELAVPLMIPILEGLQYVHERGLVHRDLKPHNIYLAAIGRPIVLDFGAARQAAGDRVQSLSVVLTEGYAPLEQYQRRAVQGPWTDVYGVAATLYRMITGAAPPIALDRIGRDPVDDAGWVGIPESLLPAMRMALAVRPSDRYQSADEFSQALSRFLGVQAPNAATAAVAPVLTKSAAESRVPSAPPGPPSTVFAAVTTPRPPEPRADLAVNAPVIKPLPSVATLAQPQAASAISALPGLPVGAGPRMPPSLLPNRSATASPPMGPGAAAKLYHRADDLRKESLSTASSMYRPVPVQQSRPRWIFMLVLAALAMLVAIYVLLHPPAGKPSKAVVATATPDAVPTAAEPAPVPPAQAEVPPPAMVGIPGGEVRLEEASKDPARPGTVKRVVVQPFKLSATEITFAQFRDFVQRTGYVNARWQNYPCESAGGRLPDWNDPGYAQRDDFPVVCVAWADANAYAQWLARVTGQSYRLPTEAEWEYAARAGTRTRFWWGDTFADGMVACQSCPPKVPTQPSAVQSFPANGFGLFEMSGNVREWTCSSFEDYTQPAAEQCTADASRIAVRGGSWQQGQDVLASGSREAYEPYRRNVWTGFRVVQELKPPMPESGAR